MKKGLLLITAFSLLLSLCACDNKKENATEIAGATQVTEDNVHTNEPTPAPLPTDPAALLEHAGQTLKAEKSFSLSLSVKGTYPEATFEGELVSVLFNTDANGVLYSVTNYYDDDYPGTLVNIRYICGNAGYDYYPTSNSNEFELNSKFYSDTPFNADFHFEPIVSWYNIMFGGDTMFENFCKLSPAVTKDESGATIYWLKELTQEQAGTILGELWDDDETTKYDIGFTVDAKGCLQKQELIMTQTEGNEKYTSAFTLTYSRVGEQIDMQTPDFEADLANAEHVDYSHYINENCYASYSRTNDNGTASFLFHYISAEDQANVPETYKILETIDSIPVRIQGDWYGGPPSAHMSKNLIIPMGVNFTGGLYYGGATLFFEDTEANVRIHAVSNMFDHLAYFAGEWNLIDGVPTPTVTKEPSHGMGAVIVD